MAEPTPNLILERVSRLTQAVADLMESQTTQGRQTNRALEAILLRFDGIEARMTRMEAAINGIAAEQALLANRIEEAFSRALRTNLRLDNLEIYDPARFGPPHG
jgi:hypothetical protein